MLRIILGGYDQKQILEYKLGVKHLIILDYLKATLADPTLQHFYEDGFLYTGIQQQKIIDDLPILDYGLYHLRHVLAELVSLEMIKTKSYSNPGCKGSKTYYTLTEKYWSLVYTDYESERPKMVTDNDQVLKKAPDVETPYLSGDEASGAKKSSSLLPSNNISTHSPKTIKASQLASKAPATETEKKKEEKKEKGKKVDLYSKCVQYIMEYTDYFKLQKALVRYLDVLLEVHRSEKKAIYFNMFVGKLNRLSTFPEDDRLEIVELATSNGWKNFYPLNNNSKPSKKGFNDVAVSEHYTEEELAKLNELEEERKAHGLQTKF